MAGRPHSSEIRQNIIDMLGKLDSGYGYELYQHYLELFPKVHLRSIYYHLKKGVVLGEVVVHDIKEDHGEYSWGDKAEKIYYSVGPKGVPKVRKKIDAYFAKVLATKL